MSRQARFEVVRSDAGWHGRFRAANGRIVWTTEVYTRRSKATAAIDLLWVQILAHHYGTASVEQVDKDERTKP